MEKDFDKLYDSIGRFIEYWGFKEVHGRVWSFIYLKEHPVSSREIKENLKISKALLSITISELKKYDLIFDSGKGAHGAEMFEANPNIFNAIIKVLETRERVLMDEILETVNKLKKESKKSLTEIDISKERLTTLDFLVKSGDKALSGLMKLDKVNFSNWKTFYKK